MYSRTKHVNQLYFNEKKKETLCPLQAATPHSPVPPAPIITNGRGTLILLSGGFAFFRAFHK